MTRPHREIPSQRLALSVSTAAKTPAVTKPRRSILWAVAITLLGWLILAYPAVLLALLSYILLAGTPTSPATAGSVVSGLAGMVFVLIMVAAPLLTGLAVSWRRRGLWVGAAAAWILTIVAVVYLTVSWIVPLT